MIKINNDAKFIIDLLNKNGFEAYIVGGAIRNLLLGIVPLDYDVTTNALPEQIIEVFKDYKTILTGVKYGTVVVVINNNNYEITTYRIDGDYINNRKPDNVIYTSSLIEDLSRRDFTINAVAFNDKLVDYHNGIEDLNNKIIRCIGNPDLRFEEDAIRILRAIKFSCKLNFVIEDMTKKSIMKKKHLLKNVSIERINKELFEIFKYKNINIIKEYIDVFLIIFDHIKKEDLNIILDKMIFLNNPILVYSLFFNESSLNLLNKYKLSNYDNHIIKFVNSKIELKNDIIECKKILKKYQINDIILYINFNVFDINKKNELLLLFKKANSECHSLKQLNINGNDLIELGYKENQIGYILNLLLDLVIENKVSNNKDELLKCIKI